MSRVSSALENLAILVVEDNPVQAQYAKESFKDENVIVVGTYSDAILQLGMNHFDAVLTDLYFPAGSVEREQRTFFKEKTLTSIDLYLKNHFEHSPLYAALQQVSNLFDVDDVETFVASDTFSLMTKNSSQMRREVYSAIEKEKLKKKYVTFKENLTNESHYLPWGLLVAESAQTSKIPVCIVTDVYHHDVAFEPFRQGLKIQYCDQLIDGRKPWRSALEKRLY